MKELLAKLKNVDFVNNIITGYYLYPVKGKSLYNNDRDMKVFSLVLQEHNTNDVTIKSQYQEEMIKISKDTINEVESFLKIGGFKSKVILLGMDEDIILETNEVK